MKQREIKFRAWDFRFNCFRKINWFQEETGLVCFKEDNYSPERGTYKPGAFGVHKPTVELTQYTGILDKNGVEIFEGDILTWHDAEVNGPKVYVKWESTDAKFYCYDVDEERDYFGGCMSEFTDDCEVVGNIYEKSDNPPQENK